MIDLKKDANHDAAPAGGARDEANVPLPSRSKSPEASANSAPPRGPVSLPDKPRRDDGKMLVVGREIVLSGEINSCDRLVVEGKVGATMKDCREIEIAETGTFKGQVEFDRADISGIFEDELTAREHLVVRATGRITGKVRFGELEIERGGQIIGDVQVFSNGAAPGKDAKSKADTPDE